MEAEACFTIEVSGAIFDEEGKILLRRRGSNEAFPGEYELPGAIISQRRALSCENERLIGETLAAGIEEKTGIHLETILKKVQPMPPMYPTVRAGGSEIAFVVIIGKLDQLPTKGEARFVGFDELCELADGPEGSRLLSGRGSTFRRCLRVLGSRDSGNELYRLSAGALLSRMHN